MLCLAGLANCLMAVNLQTISAIGKSKEMFLWTVVKRTVGIGAIVLGLFLYGMKGLLIGVLINNYFSYFVNICLVSKHLGRPSEIADVVYFLASEGASYINGQVLIANGGGYYF